MALYDELKARLEKTKREWEIARKDAREAKAREAKLYDDAVALERVLQSLQGDTGRAVPVAVVPAPRTAPEEGASVAEIVRRVVRQNSPVGVTPAEVRAKLAEQGHQLDGPYLYSVLLRSKRAGKIKERNGKYYVDVADDIRAKAAS